MVGIPNPQAAPDRSPPDFRSPFHVPAVGYNSGIHAGLLAD